jgi:hypothetical protein
VVKPSVKLLSEQELAAKKDEIISEYSVKLIEIEDLI